MPKVPRWDVVEQDGIEPTRADQRRSDLLPTTAIPRAAMFAPLCSSATSCGFCPMILDHLFFLILSPAVNRAGWLRCRAWLSGPGRIRRSCSALQRTGSSGWRSSRRFPFSADRSYDHLLIRCRPSHPGSFW